jgi:hypothetical protein
MVEAEATLLEALSRRVAALASASSPSQAFRTLLEATLLGSPRAAILLLRDELWRGWACVGYDDEVARMLVSTILPREQGWLAEVAGDPACGLRFRSPQDSGPDFGQPRYSEAVAIPLRAGARTLGVVLAERGPGDLPWCPPALEILASVASIRLEIDILQRKLRGPRADIGHAVRQETADPARGAANPDSATSAPEAPASLEPVPEPVERGPDARAWEEARRFARLIATDILLYNEETVIMGRRNRDLGRRLGDQIERGRETFLRRFPDLGDRGLLILREALDRVLGAGDSTLLD